jgi:hypothetical protein
MIPRFNRVAEGQALVDLVVGSASLAGSFDDPGLLELAEDALDGALRDPDGLGDVAHSNVRVPGNAEQYVPVITKESPCRPVFVGKALTHMTSFT